MKNLFKAFFVVVGAVLLLGACSKVEEAQDIAVTGISLDKTSIELTEGETASIKATISPANSSRQG